MGLHLFYSGLGNVASYLAAHVLLCLLPAFYIAGAMTALIPKETITRFLGRERPKYISYPAAALAGSVLAVCSCTIVPLFAGIYKKGAGLGPAITFLFFAPVANILALILLSATLLVAAIGMRPHSDGVDILITGKCLGVLISLFVLGWIIKTKFSEDQIRDLLWKSWKFVKQIFPLLVVGVFLVGVIRELIKPEWIEALAGQNTFTGNLAGVIFGVFMYFPTLVEVPIAQMFLSLGIHRGPLLAYLMADPELSLQSILITAAIIGYLKTWTYVAWVALFSTLAGFLYGIWIDGVNIMLVVLYLFIFISILSGTLWSVNKRTRNNM